MKIRCTFICKLFRSRRSIDDLRPCSSLSDFETPPPNFAQDRLFRGRLRNAGREHVSEISDDGSWSTT